LASTDAQGLFLHLWINFDNTTAPVTGGRGASALADWLANKVIAIPDLRGLFVRSAGTNGTAIGGVMYTATHGVKQGDQFQGHWHQGSLFNAGLGAGNAPTAATGTSWTANSQQAREPINGTSGTIRYGDETRPANIALNHMIRY
jgi:hypothetical protein